MLIRNRVHRFTNKVYTTAHGIVAAGMFVPRHRNILAVITGPDGPRLIPASNIVTNAGDQYYAQKGAGETPTNDFAAGLHELASAGTPGKSADRSSFTLISNTQKAHASGYPKTNDGDADNTGAGADIVSYLADYAKADFNSAGISHGLITVSGPGASSPILTGYAFASAFEKTSNDTLKVFVNHEAAGV